MPTVTLCPFCPSTMHPGRLLSHITCKHKNELVEHNYIAIFEQMVNSKDGNDYVFDFGHETSNHGKKNYDNLKRFDESNTIGRAYNCCFACNKSFKCDRRNVCRKRSENDGYFSKGFNNHYSEYDGTKNEHDAKHLEEFKKFITDLKKIQKKQQRQEKAQEKQETSEAYIKLQNDYDELDTKYNALNEEKLDEIQEAVANVREEVADINQYYFEAIVKLNTLYNGQIYSKSLNRLYNTIRYIYRTQKGNDELIKQEINKITFQHYNTDE